MKFGSFCAIPLGLALTVVGASAAPAQEKCKMSWEVPFANNNFTQQHVIDVGDVPGHQVRILELHRVFPDDKPNCEGLKRIESWIRGYSDYVDRNGRSWAYEIIVIENGDRIFGEFNGTTQTIVNPNGTTTSSSVGVTRYTGGTGKYQGVRGIQRSTNIFDPDKNSNQGYFEAEYWIEK